MGYIGLLVSIAIIGLGVYFYIGDKEEGIPSQYEIGKSAIEEAEKIKETLESRSFDIENE